MSQWSELRKLALVSLVVLAACEGVVGNDQASSLSLSVSEIPADGGIRPDARFDPGFYPDQYATAVDPTQLAPVLESYEQQHAARSTATAILREYASRATSVAHVACVNVTSFEAAGPSPIMSDIEYTVIDLIKGPLPPALLRLRGGRVGAREVFVSSVPIPEPNQHYILFAREVEPGVWSTLGLLDASNDGTLSVVGVLCAPAQIGEILTGDEL